MKRVFLKASSCLLLFIYLLGALTGGAFAAEERRFDAVKCCTGATVEAFSTISGTSVEHKRDDGVRVSSRLWELLFGGKSGGSDEVLLYPGGGVFGLLIDEEGVTVTASDSKALRSGDRILAVDGVTLGSARELEEAIKTSGGRKVALDLIRGGERITLSVTPRLDGGEYRLGVKLRSQTAGIGTVTFVDPDTLAFGGLGHGVTDAESGGFVSIKSASVNRVTLGGCKRGEGGYAGELTGVLKRDTFGNIVTNCECGVFGRLTELPDYCTEAMPVGGRDELECGAAEIISTVKNGHRDVYDVEIYDIDATSTGSKSFKIKVTDPTLIAITGGIVRGMSGSPIIQNGKLVGAVTHVMLANPTEGYGIFIENMLNAAESQTQQKAA